MKIRARDTDALNEILEREINPNPKHLRHRHHDCFEDYQGQSDGEPLRRGFGAGRLTPA
jgi:hypothetical protein